MTKISNSGRKLVQSLRQKKSRNKLGLFVVDGEKMVAELLDSGFAVEQVYALPSWIARHPAVGAVELSASELRGISCLKTPNQVLAVVRKPHDPRPALAGAFTIALDHVRDPGNLGSILRTADWFGITTVLCSTDCVDVYNAKVLQASMGSIFRVQVLYTDLAEIFRAHPGSCVYGATLQGENVYRQAWRDDGGILLMGNESSGISAALLPFIKQQVAIPRFGQAESLNVAVATALICSEWKRQQVAGDGRRA